MERLKTREERRETAKRKASLKMNVKANTKEKQVIGDQVNTRTKLTEGDGKWRG